jgi:hypothetical protein
MFKVTLVVLQAVRVFVSIRSGLVSDCYEETLNYASGLYDVNGFKDKSSNLKKTKFWV